jgi:hypothetical protein
MIVEIYTQVERLLYLQKNVKNIVELSEPDVNGQLKISIEVNGSIDVMNIFHAGISYGLDAMSNALIKR